MKTPVKKLLFWAPRVLCLLFACFISLFALDVFDEARGLWQTALAFAAHLVPTAIILVILAVSWRWEWVGAVLFTGLAACYVIGTWGRFRWPAYAGIAGPLFVVGLLFLLNWVYRAQLRSNPRP